MSEHTPRPEKGPTDVSVPDLTDSRAATDALLGTLRDGRWRRYAVARFLGLAADRSVRQAARRPRALAQLTVLHGLLFVVARDPGRGWVAANWLLAALHLGLLERRDRLAPADALTLIRDSLPATALGSCRWSGLVSVGLDLSDGRLARRQETVSPFGDYADSLADAAARCRDPEVPPPTPSDAWGRTKTGSATHAPGIETDPGRENVAPGWRVHRLMVRREH
ncbi:CDP-alcohol phosphatidyltransferase family protein [Streptomyces sp. 2A115]|uniref:CDP-alcohol phosphatidyltransferase family protein n=1 Tax=Streptomyces sp. 2A115 TaxID=3457439 RepID=UPI003FD06967